MVSSASDEKVKTFNNNAFIRQTNLQKINITRNRQDLGTSVIQAEGSPILKLAKCKVKDNFGRVRVWVKISCLFTLALFPFIGKRKWMFAKSFYVGLWANHCSADTCLKIQVQRVLPSMTSVDMPLQNRSRRSLWCPWS